MSKIIEKKSPKQLTIDLLIMEQSKLIIDHTDKKYNISLNHRTAEIGRDL